VAATCSGRLVRLRVCLGSREGPVAPHRGRNGVGRSAKHAERVSSMRRARVDATSLAVDACGRDQQPVNSVSLTTEKTASPSSIGVPADGLDATTVQSRSRI
jgi:hypothetical protein